MIGIEAKIGWASAALLYHIFVRRLEAKWEQNSPWLLRSEDQMKRMNKFVFHSLHVMCVRKRMDGGSRGGKIHSMLLLKKSLLRYWIGEFSLCFGENTLHIKRSHTRRSIMRSTLKNSYTVCQRRYEMEFFSFFFLVVFVHSFSSILSYRVIRRCNRSEYIIVIGGLHVATIFGMPSFWILFSIYLLLTYTATHAHTHMVRLSLFALVQIVYHSDWAGVGNLFSRV